MPRVIIFCQRYDDCAALYETFLIALGNEFTEPVGAPNVMPLLLVDIYTSPTHKAGKDAIVSSFHTADSQLYVVICTLCLGVNFPDVRQVIHWGPPSDIEEYMHQTGRAGRDERLTCALVLVKPSDLSRMKDRQLVQYCENTTTCRRKLLLQPLRWSWFQKGLWWMTECCDVYACLYTWMRLR